MVTPEESGGNNSRGDILFLKVVGGYMGIRCVTFLYSLYAFYKAF